MIPALRAEFRKMFTTRSTYVIIGFILVLMIFFGLFISGWKSDASQLRDPASLTGDITGAVQTVSVFWALLAILLMTQEYRYNLIAYTLTASNNRNKVLAAKFILCSIVGIAFTLLTAVLSPLLSVWGANLHGLHFAPQIIHHGKLFWECLFYGWGYTMAGLLFGALIRNQIGAIITLFIAPDTVEAILSLLLKHNTIYLPFTALSYVLGQPVHVYQGVTMSAPKAALVFSAYLVVGWVTAWILFLRRDAMN
jgi:ABC-2 type transport system permease protein